MFSVYQQLDVWKTGRKKWYCETFVLMWVHPIKYGRLAIIVWFAPLYKVLQLSLREQVVCFHQQYRDEVLIYLTLSVFFPAVFTVLHFNKL